MKQVEMTALMTGFPPGISTPKPLPGETLGQLVIRNYPREWRNCVAMLGSEFAVGSAICDQLLRGGLNENLNKSAQDEIKRFMTRRLPSYGRTLDGLAEVRRYFADHRAGSLRVSLCNILWPRQIGLAGEAEAEEMSKVLEVESLIVDQAGPLDLGAVLQHVCGEYLWILPGGSRLDGPTTVMRLNRVLLSFESDAKLALYSDQLYCKLYRTRALRTLMASGQVLSANLGESARMLVDAGFQVSVGDPAMPLAEIEALYGRGTHRATDPAPPPDKAFLAMVAAPLLNFREHFSESLFSWLPWAVAVIVLWPPFLDGCGRARIL